SAGAPGTPSGWRSPRPSQRHERHLHVETEEGTRLLGELPARSAPREQAFHGAGCWRKAVPCDPAGKHIKKSLYPAAALTCRRVFRLLEVPGMTTASNDTRKLERGDDV